MEFFKFIAAVVGGSAVAATLLGGVVGILRAVQAKHGSGSGSFMKVASR